jgi:hypothetical protein
MSVLNVFYCDIIVDSLKYGVRTVWNRHEPKLNFSDKSQFTSTPRRKFYRKMHPVTFHEGPQGSKCIALLFL